MSIRLSSEELNKERERQTKKAKLIFNTLKKGKVKVDLYDPDILNPEVIFQYQIHNAHFRSMVDYTDGSVRSIVICFYDDVDITNQDGSEIRENLPMWLVSGIEMELIKKFDGFNVELSMRESDDGKKTVVKEGVEDDENQKMIHKAKLIYKALKKGKIEIRYDHGNGYTHDLKIINWTLPNKFILKVKKYDYLISQKLGREKYVVLVLDSQTIDIVTNDGTRLTNSENFSMVMKINEQFKKHNITVYWSGGSSLPDPESTQIDLTPKSK